MSTILMNNFCSQYPELKAYNSRFSYDGNVTNEFVCLQGTGMRGACAYGESVSRSFVETFGHLVMHSHRAGRRVFGMIAPHEAHQVEHHKLLGVQTWLLKLLRDLDAQGVLAKAALFFLADHGLHYGYDVKSYVPSAAAHRNPVLVALLGNRVLLPELVTALPVALRNRGRLISMHDVYATLGPMVGLPQARIRPGAINFLRSSVPRNRTCTEAGVLKYCNCWHQRALDETPSHDLII
jgi:hypothetical protein